MAGELTKKDLDDCLVPTAAQRRAKARFDEAVSKHEGLRDPSTLNVEELCSWAGTLHVKRWLENPKFLPWLLDKDNFKTRANALKDLALSRLEELVEAPLDFDGKTYTAKDLLKAIEMSMNLAGAFPSRTKEIIWADQSVGKMAEEEVEAEIKRVNRMIEGPD